MWALRVTKITVTCHVNPNASLRFMPNLGRFPQVLLLLIYKKDHFFLSLFFHIKTSSVDVTVADDTASGLWPGGSCTLFSSLPIQRVQYIFFHLTCSRARPLTLNPLCEEKKKLPLSTFHTPSSTPTAV